MLHVDRVDPRGEDPGTKMTDAITQGGARGWKLIQILPMQNEILIVWEKPKTEKRG